MTIELGTTDINKFYLGSIEINKILLGSTAIFDTTGGGGGVAGAWDLDNASYASKSFGVSGQETFPNGIFFKDDGTEMFICGFSETVHAYTLSVAWDVSTASANASKDFDLSTQTSTASGLFIGNSGSTMYVTNGTPDDSILQYTLGTAWNPSTATYDGEFLIDNSPISELNPQCVYVSSDGTELYFTGQTNDNVYQCTMNTPWDISTMSYTRALSVTAQASVPTGLFFKDDGTVMFVQDRDNGIFEYALSTAWDISSATYSSKNFDRSANEEPRARAMYWSPDGDRLYQVGQDDDTVYQYDVST